MPGLFITFEGTEGGGKSTQITLLAERLRALKRIVQVWREPGSTSIGEEIRHTLQHSAANAAMMPETELLLVNASRAQLVREKIRPALASGEVVLCDRFSDSTTAYQGYGRQLDLAWVKATIDFVVGDTRPHLTLLLQVPLTVSETRRRARSASASPLRDRMEEADQKFFERVEEGYRSIAAREPTRIKVIDATRSVKEVQESIWQWVQPLVGSP